MTQPRFSGGPNIAMKVPAHQWEATVGFYRDVLGLRELPEHAPNVVFAFGANRLWIDKENHLSQAEVWLELTTDNTESAAGHLERAEVVRRDEIEALPEGFDGYWISNPGGIIHLVTRENG